jgi:hypothetical protein
MRHQDYELPHVTIQMPVYKEGLKGVIIPTVTSLLAAVRYYEAQGGTASIFVNEDGKLFQSFQGEISNTLRHAMLCTRDAGSAQGLLRAQ